MEENSQIRNTVQIVEQYARTGRCEEAIAILKKEIVKWPGEVLLWSTLAYVHARNKEYDEALHHISKAISLSGKEPHNFYMRGQYLIKLKKFADAENDFTQTIELCKKFNWDYYLEPSYFYRAECRIQQKKYKEAESDCRHISTPMKTWVGRIKTKKDLLAEIENAKKNFNDA